MMRELEPKPKKKEVSVFNRLSSIGASLKKSVTSITVERKVECAWQFSDIEMIESTNVCSSESTEMFVQSSWADLILAIYLKGRDTPMILVCSKPEQREAWVDAFRTCYVNSVQLRAKIGFREAKKIISQVGWQHLVIRSSLFSLVVCNDLTELKEHLRNPAPDMYIDDEDEYCGYTLLHYGK